MEIMRQTGIKPAVIRAGQANMFLSPVFRETLAGVTGATIELYDTDGAQGAAKGAGVGAGYYKSFAEAFSGLHKNLTVQPDTAKQAQYEEAYQRWLGVLEKILTNNEK
jgi:xylulokinase